MWVPLLFAVLAVAPCWMVLRFRKRVLVDSGADSAAAWFAHLRNMQVIATATWLVWLGLVMVLDPWRTLAFALGVMDPVVISLLHYGLGVLVPPTVLTICEGLAHPIVARVRGLDFTLWETIRDSMLLRFTLTVPAVCIFASFWAYEGRPILANSMVVAGLLFAGAMLFWRARRNRRLNLLTHAVSFGPVRDRAFELAERAGVKLNAVYVLPVGRLKLANAFAGEGNNVILTDWLLKHLTRREVDAVIAHELAHMKGNHLALLGLIAFAVIIGPMIALEIPHVQRLLDPVTMTFGAIAFINVLHGFSSLLSRRFERQADKGAVAICQDPEALITSLWRLNQLNLMPAEWDKFTENFLTHPSTARRVQLIAAEGKLPPEHIAALLRTSRTDEDHYPLPTNLQQAIDAGEQPIYNTRFRMWVELRGTVLVMAGICVPPLVTAWLTARQSWNLPATLYFYGAGVALTFLVVLFVMDHAGRWATARLRKRLQERLQKAGFEFDASAACYVGFSPHESARVYENSFDWDLGFLVLLPTHLVYLGEQAQFKLRRDQLVETQIGPGEPNWLSSKRLYVKWLDDQQRMRTFNLAPASLTAISQTRHEVKRLAERLTGVPTAQSGTALLQKLEAPVFGEVTNKTPKAALSFGTCAAIGGMLLVVQMGLINTLELPRLSWLATLYSLAMVFFGLFTVYWPTWRFRENDSGTPACDNSAACRSLSDYPIETVRRDDWN